VVDILLGSEESLERSLMRIVIDGFDVVDFLPDIHELLRILYGSWNGVIVRNRIMRMVHRGARSLRAWQETEVILRHLIHQIFHLVVVAGVHQRIALDEELLRFRPVPALRWSGCLLNSQPVDEVQNFQGLRIFKGLLAFMEQGGWLHPSM